MIGHICFSVRKNCYNHYESYGMICVGCGCCSSDKKKRLTARIELHKRLLKHDMEFDGWFDDLETRKLQEENIAKNIEWGKKLIAKYEAELNGGVEDDNQGT